MRLTSAQKMWLLAYLQAALVRGEFEKAPAYEEHNATKIRDALRSDLRKGT